MRKYVVRRLLLFVPTLFLVSVIIFAMLRVLPGDPALALMGETAEREDIERLRVRLGLDRPIVIQYVDWIAGIFRGDWGVSFRFGTPVREQIVSRLPTTLELATGAALLGTILALPIGVLAATNQDRWMDYVLRTLAIAGLALPTFWLGTLVIMALSIFFNWLPPLGYSSLWEDPTKNIQQLIWPMAVLGVHMNASLMRMTRAQMLEVLRQDFVRTARAKGLAERMVIYRHAMKNALLPVLTMAGVQVSYLMGGAVITETIFNVPGVGRLMVDAVSFRDYTLTQALVLFFATLFVTMNLIIDMVYAWIDPRIRYA